MKISKWSSGRRSQYGDDVETETLSVRRKPPHKGSEAERNLGKALGIFEKQNVTASRVY